jgi:long-chain-fatty-acid--CoA ligase ACSBG
MMQLHCGLCVYYARPDALQGTLVQTLQWAKPTAFLGVPRIWEKFEEKLKSIAAEKGGLAQSISKWAKGLGYANTQAKIKHQSAPFCYSLANFLILKRIKQALGLDECKYFLFGAAPLKRTTLDYFASLDIPIQGAYGLSETTGGITV